MAGEVTHCGWIFFLAELDLWGGFRAFAFSACGFNVSPPPAIGSRRSRLLFMAHCVPPKSSESSTTRDNAKLGRQNPTGWFLFRRIPICWKGEALLAQTRVKFAADVVVAKGSDLQKFAIRDPPCRRGSRCLAIRCSRSGIIIASFAINQSNNQSIDQASNQ